jgi:TatA/E family protein of Tat protein translocase
MFGSLGLPELLMIFAVALIVFGPRRLPEIGKTLGKALNEFKKASDDLKNTIEREVQVEETKQALAPLISPATYTISRAEPVTAPAGDNATPAASSTTHEAPSSPNPTHFE